MLEMLKDRWNALIALATVLATGFAKFLIPPPTDTAQNAWFNYGIVLTAIAIGLWLVPMTLWNERRQVWRWWSLAGVFALVSVIAVTKYISLFDEWTVPYFGEERVIVGNHLTTDAERYRQKIIQQGLPADDLTLLRDYGGKSYAVWTRESVQTRAELLRDWYLGTLFVLASTVVTVAQASYCVSKQRTSTGSPGGAPNEQV